ncbi:hypothetical protein Ocin01_19321, partial [Orchesella cincta]
FLLVEWVGHDTKQFSVVKVSDLVDGNLRTNPSKAVGSITMCQWGRNKEFKAKVLKIGKEKDLDNEADALAEREWKQDDRITINGKCAPKKVPKRNRKPKLPSASTRTLDSVLATFDESMEYEDPTQNEVLSGSNQGREERIDVVIPETESEVHENCMNDETEQARVNVVTGDIAESETVDYKAKYKQLKIKYKDLKNRFRALKNETGSETMVEIYPSSGVLMKKGDLDAIKLLSNQMTVLARNMFRSIFTPEELASHSLYGKSCNANKTQVPLPAIDCVKRDAVIKFVLEEYNLSGTVLGNDKVERARQKAAKREIVKSLSDFLREETRKSKV